MVSLTWKRRMQIRPLCRTSTISDPGALEGRTELGTGKDWESSLYHSLSLTANAWKESSFMIATMCFAHQRTKCLRDIQHHSDSFRIRALLVATWQHCCSSTSLRLCDPVNNMGPTLQFPLMSQIEYDSSHTATIQYLQYLHSM